MIAVFSIFPATTTTISLWVWACCGTVAETFWFLRWKVRGKVGFVEGRGEGGALGRGHVRGWVVAVGKITWK